MDVVQQLNLLASTSLTASLILTSKLIRSTGNGKETIICVSLGFTSLLCMTSGFILYLKPSSSHTWRSLFTQFLSYLIMPSISKKIYKQQIESPSKRQIEEVQKEVLLKLCKLHKDTAYGQDHNLESVTSVEDFLSRVPLNDYSTLEKYMNRTQKGEKDVLYPGNVEFLFKTSGTTGSNKTFPSNWERIKLLSTPCLASVYPRYSWIKRLTTLGKTVMIRVFTQTRLNEHGIKITPMSQMFHLPEGLCTLPNAATEGIFHEATVMYVNAVFSLREESVNVIECVFPSLAISFIRTLEEHWTDICGDIERGKLSENIQLSEDLRKLLNTKLRPKPKRAEQLRNIFQNGFHDIFKRIWPDVAYITLINSASFKCSFDYLKANKYLGSVQYYSTILGGTEGITGVNCKAFNMEVPEYTFFVMFAFFELLPVEDLDKEDPRTILLHEAQVGETYEVVVTNSNGLYRYRVGDCVTITGFNGSIPTFSVSHRSSHCLNLISEKLNEDIFQKALLEVFNEEYGGLLVDYTVTENCNYATARELTDNKLYYVLFLELRNSSKLDKLSKSLGSMMDEKLREIHENYNWFRTDERIQEIQVVFLKQNAFVEFKELVLDENPDTSASQFKLPRVIRNIHHLKFICDREIDH